MPPTTQTALPQSPRFSLNKRDIWQTVIGVAFMMASSAVATLITQVKQYLADAPWSDESIFSLVGAVVVGLLILLKRYLDGPSVKTIQDAEAGFVPEGYKLTEVLMKTPKP